MILANSAKCLECGDDIYSAHRHDHVSCSCENIFVDGGMDYLRHGFRNKLTYFDTSIIITTEQYKACEDALVWAKDSGRNDLGTICAIFRALRDNDLLKDKK